MPVATFMQNDITLLKLHISRHFKSNVQGVALKACAVLSKSEESVSLATFVFKLVAISILWQFKNEISSE